jgi:hypothetical protein
MPRITSNTSQTTKSPRRAVKRVATRKRKKRSWLKTLLIYISIPIGIWLAALLIWFYWHDLTGLVSNDKAPRGTPSKVRRVERDEASPTKRPQEKILEEDRQKLEEVLKRRS